MKHVHKLFLILIITQLSVCAPWIDMSKINPPVLPQVSYVFNSKLPIDQRVRGDDFGQGISLSADGQTILISASGDGYEGDSPGSAYIYHLQDEKWQESELLPPDGKVGDQFGHSVSLAADGQTAAIGSIGVENIGSVYLYHTVNNQWIWTGHKITALVKKTNDGFGSSVALSADGNTLLAGAPNDEGKGAAYIYHYQSNDDQWEETRLTSTQTTAGDRYGSNVALSADGQTILIGTGWNVGTGIAYLYQWRNNQWLETTFTAGNGGAGARFCCGGSLSADGQTVLLAAYNYLDTYASIVNLYRWQDNRWEEYKIADACRLEVSGIQVSLSADGQTVLAGIRTYVELNEQAGSAYIYRWNNDDWLKVELKVPAGDWWDNFGLSVALSADGKLALAGIERYRGQYSYGEVCLFRYLKQDM